MWRHAEEHYRKKQTSLVQQIVFVMTFKEFEVEYLWKG